MSTERTYQFAAPLEPVWNALLAIAEEQQRAVKKADTATRQMILYQSKSLFKQWAWNRILGIRFQSDGRTTAVTFRADTVGQLAVFGFRAPAEHQFIEQIAAAAATKVPLVSASPFSNTLI